MADFEERIKAAGVAAGRWINLISINKLEKGDVTPVRFNDRLLAVYDLNEGYSVSDARCTHGGANLCDGYFDGRHIECPLHQGLFDARSGAAKAAPATKPLQIFESRVVKDMLQVRL